MQNLGGGGGKQGVLWYYSKWPMSHHVQVGLFLFCYFFEAYFYIIYIDSVELHLGLLRYILTSWVIVM